MTTPPELEQTVTTDRATARRQLGAAAVLSEAEAVRLLPGRDSTCRTWLRDRGLVRDTPLGRVVVWGEVLEALAAPAPPPVVRGKQLPRVKL